MPLLAIDVFSDVVCPWCLIGSRRLVQALRTLQGTVEAEVVHHPFLLNPRTPPEGEDLRAHLGGKFGRDPEKMFASVEAAAKSSGIPLDFAKITRYSNTLKAHTLIRKALAKGTQPALVDALFRAYFLEGRDVGDGSVLATVAGSHGFTAEEVARIIGDDCELAATRRETEAASSMGIRGVPFFIFGKRLAFSGAQAPETFIGAIEQALKGTAQENTSDDK